MTKTSDRIKDVRFSSYDHLVIVIYLLFCAWILLLISTPVSPVLPSMVHLLQPAFVPVQAIPDL